MKTIFFAGNPNVGKSALINALSGSKLKIGNWPGVTIAKKEAEMKINDETFHLIDLPGIYGLGEATAEEIVTKEALMNSQADLIVNVLDVTNLERNLYLTLNLRELQIPMLIVLNFADQIKDIPINQEHLSKVLSSPVISASATSNFHINELKDAIYQASHAKIKGGFYHVYFGGELEKAIVELVNLIAVKTNIDNPNSLVVKIIDALQNKEDAIKYFENLNVEISLFTNIRERLEKTYDEPLFNIFQLERHKMVAIIAKAVINIEEVSKRRLQLTKKLDRIFLHRFFGFPLFLLIIVLFMSAIFNFSLPLISWMEELQGFIAKYIGYFTTHLPDPVHSFIVDGLIGGVGGVIVFIPLLFLVFLMTAILEESGYISRVSFLLDRLMRSLGVSGKSFIPLLIGFGCNVPAIYASRSLEDQRARKITAFMVPFMSCGARLPIYALFGAAFFGAKIGVIIILLYLIGILLSLIVAVVLNRFFLKAEEKSELIIELPPYHIPNIKIVFKKSFQEVRGYLKKAGGIIAVTLIILWFLSYFPHNGDVNRSFIASFGQFFSVIFRPLGFGVSWEVVASIPGSIVAKEAVVGFLSQITQFSKPSEIVTYDFFKDFLELAKNLPLAFFSGFKNFITFNFGALFANKTESEVTIALRSMLGNDGKESLRAFSFMIYILLTVPCIVTLGAIKQEFGKKMLGQVLLINLLVPYIVALLTYNIGLLFI